MAGKPPGWNNPPNKTIARTNRKAKPNFSPKKYDDLVKSQGVRVLVFRTVFCPNVKSIDGAEHEIDCPLCKGSLFIDEYPIETKAVIQNQSLNKNPQVEGYIDVNTIHATFLQGVDLQYFTLVQLCDFQEAFYERVKRSSGDSDVLKYFAHRVNLAIDSRGVKYLEGSDFAIDGNGGIRWKPNKGPSTSEIYSIHYFTAVQYRAIEANHSNRFVQVDRGGVAEMVKMNEQWTLEKDYLVERKDVLGQPLKPNPIRDPDEE